VSNIVGDSELFNSVLRSVGILSDIMGRGLIDSSAGLSMQYSTSLFGNGLLNNVISRNRDVSSELLGQSLVDYTNILNIGLVASSVGQVCVNSSYILGRGLSIDVVGQGLWNINPGLSVATSSIMVGQLITSGSIDVVALSDLRRVYFTININRYPAFTVSGVNISPDFNISVIQSPNFNVER
jgi:hypothetical protein